MSRTDRNLVLIAILVLLCTGVVLYKIDTWYSYQHRDEEDAVAQIIDKSGDIRVKFSDQIQWQKGDQNQRLIYNDSVFAGSNAKADIKIGNSKLTLDSNTLIVLRKEQLFNSLNLNYGALNGLIAKNDRLVIETGGGDKFELSAKEASKVSIVRKHGKTSLKVYEGSAKIVKDGKTQSLSSRDSLVIEDIKSKYKSDPISIDSPTGQLFYSINTIEPIKIFWSYSSKRQIEPTDQFTVEFSNSSTFTTLSLKEDVLGLATLNAVLTSPSESYYRIRDGYGNYSEVRKLSLRGLSIPTIISPNELDDFEVSNGGQIWVNFAFSEREPESRFWLQVARDPEFKSLVQNRTFIENKTRHVFREGMYYARVKNVYSQRGLQSAWSEVRRVLVREKLDLQILTRVPSSVITIPNQKYPSSWYRASIDELQNVLKDATSFKEYFKDVTANGYDLVVNRHRTDELPVRLSNVQFPKEWIYPSEQSFDFELQARGKVYGQKRSHSLKIIMAPPNRLEFDSRKISWSPILFSEKYEGEVKDDLGKVVSFKSSNFQKKFLAQAGRKYSFRVRALGIKDAPISDWSRIYIFKGPPVVEQPVLAKKEEPEPEPVQREPAQEKASSHAKVEEKYTPWQKVGYWLWTGTGFNYLNVRQTVASTADAKYRNTHGSTLFLEAGYLSSNRWGGVFSYKRTPGDIRIDNYTIQNGRSFVWDSYTAEALYALPWASKLWRHNVNWGLRGGLQYHSFPFLNVQSGSRLYQTQSQILAGSFGFFAETDGRFKYHWHMRYQHPVQSSTEGGNSFDVSPVVAFDGSVGASYLLTQRLKTGLFWYGQLHAYDFNYQTSTQANSGQQTLFYSNMELRLGLDF